MSARRIIGNAAGGLLVHDARLGILWVLPDPKRESDPVVASALALRNRATLEGVCPGCGAAEQPSTEAVVIEHTGDCPAGTERLTALMRARQRRGRGRARGARGGNR